MWNEGLAACSILTLGCVCRGGALFAGGCTGGGILGLGATVSSSSSSRFTESIMPRRDEVEVAVVGRELLDAGGSFCGGAGGASGADGGDGAPRGPRGSSTTSRRGA